MTISKLLFRIPVIIIFFIATCLLCIYLNYNYVSFSVKDQIYTNTIDFPFRPFTLVLGSGNYEPEKYTNYSLNYRAEAVFQIMQHNKTQTIIASGIKSETGMNEAADLKTVMGLIGIDTSKVILDSAASRTFESITNTINIVGENGFIMVSQKDHLERALFISNCIGLDAIGYVATTPKNPQHNLFFREYLARIKCIYDCIKFNLF